MGSTGFDSAFNELYHVESKEDFELQWNQMSSMFGLGSDRHIALHQSVRTSWALSYVRGYLHARTISAAFSNSVDVLSKRIFEMQQTCIHSFFEQMVDTVISSILNQLTTILMNEVKLLAGFDDEVVKLRRNLETIHAVLEDAEEKQVTSLTVKLWLSRLKELSYDMDDLLDEWSTVLLLSEVSSEEGQKVLLPHDSGPSSSFKGKVCAFFSCCCLKRVATRHVLGVEIKKMSVRLDEIVKDKVFSELSPREIRRDSSRRHETTAFVDAAKIRGRDGIMRTLMDSLFGYNGGSDQQSISIVGMGGIGKTALAQKIYNDSLVVQSFEKRMWVCVSDFFDESRVAKAIIAALEGLDHNSVYLLENVPLQALMERICRGISGKRFFLVLDDVWTEDDRDFESLKRTFTYGAVGSKILVTTRKDGVAKMMNSSRIFHLDLLSQEECWQVLSEAACFERRSSEERELLEGIGRQIAGKCKGLPLAANTLGSLLRNKKSREEWENVLHNEVWERALGAMKDIFAPLLISYYDLPLKIRLCFVYCAIYPKDFVIQPKRHLIHLWMAQGYLSLEGNPEMELVGMEYFNYLAKRSFFQDFWVKIYDYPNDEIYSCKMHDIVHDFALYLADKEFLTKHVTSESEGSTLDLSACEKLRHLTVMVAEGVELPPSISGTEKLRSIISFSGDDAITTPALQSLVRGSKRLRTIHLENLAGDQIPSEIGKLLHLRHLSLFSRRISELPETICELINLIYFFGCPNLERLPMGIGKLTNLRTLNTVDCYKLTGYPKGVGRLTALRELFGVITIADRDDPQQFSLADLGNLNNLRSLVIKLKGERVDIGEAQKAKMENKMHLHTLWIEYDRRMTEEAANVLIPLNRPVDTRVTKWLS